MVLALFLPGLFLLFLLAMEWVEARLLPASSTVEPGPGAIDHRPGPDLAAHLPTQRRPPAGAVTLPAAP